MSARMWEADAELETAMAACDALEEHLDEDAEAGLDSDREDAIVICWEVPETLTASEALHRALAVADAVDWPAGSSLRGIETDVSPPGDRELG